MFVYCICLTGPKWRHLLVLPNKRSSHDHDYSMSLFRDASHRLPSPQRSKLLTIFWSPGQSCGSLSQCSVCLCLAHAVWLQQQCAWSLQCFVWLADHVTVYLYSLDLRDPTVLSVFLSPWYNRNGWLSVKHQVTYSVSVSVSVSLCAAVCLLYYFSSL